MSEDPAEALRSVREVQQKAALRAKVPAYYHWSMGGVFFLLFVALELEAKGSGLVAVALSIVAILTASQQKRTGIMMTGAGGGGPKTKLLMWGGVAFLLALMGIGLALKYGFGIDGALVALGALAAPSAVWLGFAWQRSFIAEAGGAR